MKKVCTLIMLLALSFNEMSCINQNTNNDNSDFSLSDKKMGFTKDDPRVSAFTFEYSGDITNETKNIYKEATVTMTLEFTLENGKVLTDVDMAEGKQVFGAAEAFDMVEMFQPRQVYNIKDLQTEVISDDYIKYPVKSVSATFTIKLEDEINGTNNESTIKSEDITNEWKKAVNGNFGKDFHDAEVDSTNATIKN